MGITVSLLTGDGVETARAVAKEVGIEESEVWAGVSPKGKAKIVKELVEKMRRGGVAMVSLIVQFLRLVSKRVVQTRNASLISLLRLVYVFPCRSETESTTPQPS